MAQKQQEKKAAKNVPTEEAKANPETIGKGDKIKKKIDEIVDNIDDILEENAEEFVKNYQQRGGE